MAGVLRPYTLADVLGTIVAASQPNQDMLSGLGLFAEADETIPLGDSWTSTAAVPNTWDNGVWGATLWS